MGSHAKYDSRIPDDWPYLSLPGADETENDYATTVDYTDYVLKISSTTRKKIFI